MNTTPVLSRTHTQHYTRKMHLEGLGDRCPDFPIGGVPQKDIAFVIPLFSLTDAVDAVERYLAKTAAWSLWTWLRHSDLHAYGASCMIYVESGAVAEAALPILRSHGVPDKYIKVADFDRTAWLGKCLQPLFDKTFDAYQYLCISDSDVFATPGKNKGRLAFCENALKTKNVGVGCKIFNAPIPGYWMPHLKHLFEHKTKTQFDTSVDLAEVWLRSFETLTGVDVSDYWGQYIWESEHRYPWTGVMLIPQGTFSDADKVFIEKTSMIFGDDEAILYAWITQNPERNKIWDIETIGVYLAESIMKYFEKAEQDDLEVLWTGWLHFDDTFVHEPCLLHHSSSIEYKFQEAIGIPS